MIRVSLPAVDNSKLTEGDLPSTSLSYFFLFSNLQSLQTRFEGGLWLWQLLFYFIAAMI